jgi:hypothetical protein
MPYASAVTVTPLVHNGRRHWLVTVTETAVALSTNEWTVTLETYGPPVAGWVTLHQCVLTAGVGGTGTTIDPRLGRSTGAYDIFDNGTPAASTYQGVNVRYLLTGGTLYGSSRCDGTTAGAGSIVTKFVIMEGHQT